MAWRAMLVPALAAGLVGQDLMRGFWEPRPALREARQEVGAAAAGGSVYVAGGLGAAGQPLASVERWDPASGAWSAAAPLPTTLHHFGMAELGGRLYVVGGYIAGFRGTAACWVYDPAANRWSAIRALPNPRGALVAVASGGRIFAVGGVDPARGVVGDLTAYDPALDVWQSLAPMNVPREHLAAAAAGGRIYAAGGRAGGSAGGNYATLEEYDPAIDRWTPGPPMPTARGGNGAVAIGGEIVVMGGEAFNPSRTFVEAEAYDPVSRTWRTLASMPVGLHGIYPVVVGDTVIVPGGADVAGYAATNRVLAFAFLPDAVDRFGVSTPACAGEPLIGVDTLPLAGTGLRASTWRGAPPLAPGVLALGIADEPGTPFLGARLHIAPGAWLLVPAAATARGAASAVVPLPRGLAGQAAAAQFVFANPTGCTGTGPLSASGALRITVR